METNRILTNLPKIGSKVNWKDTVGLNLELYYYGETYKVVVIKHCKSKSRLWVDYNGYVYENGIKTSHMMNGNFGSILKIRSFEFKYETGERLNDNNRDIVIIKKEYGLKYKMYGYTCNKCGWDEGWISEGNLNRGDGCSCCSGHTVVEHINSMWKTDYWMIGLGVSEEDAKTHTKSSNKKIEVTCPDCGRKKSVIINNIYKRKSICCACGDGLSYPEKFMNSVLSQLGVEFEIQYSPEWIRPKRYDFYLPDFNMIIETHGKQHYEDCSWCKCEDVQDNDKYKRDVALDNKVSEYIEIDCRESDIDWIKNSILNSKLNDIFDMSKIDWTTCEEFALSNLVKEVCNYWKNKEEWETDKDLVNIFGLNKATIIKYLKKGTKLEWCIYPN